MRLEVYRDSREGMELVGAFASTDFGIRFFYDVRYVQRGEEKGEFGISETMPLDFGHYEPQEYAPFFQGLLPEGVVLANLAERYQVPRNDFLAFFEKLGCESIGALTFVAEGSRLTDFEPSYAPLEHSAVEQLRHDAERAVTEMTDELRLSLSGAQSKVAWYLPEEIDARDAALDDWLLPLGTAPSSHIVKVARKGREELAYNEFVCMEIARQCGFTTPDVALIPEIPGAIAIKRYDRVPLDEGGLVRLHQEDFCQARGLPLYLKYADAHPEISYVRVIAELINAVSERPAQDRLEMTRRLLLHYLIGNSDNHLKNYAFLYSEDWKHRTLAPLYDLTCIPLTGYSTKMAFALGSHRELSDIAADDLAGMAQDMGISLKMAIEEARLLAERFEAIDPVNFEVPEVRAMTRRVVENAIPRLAVLRSFAEL